MRLLLPIRYANLSTDKRGRALDGWKSFSITVEQLGQQAQRPTLVRLAPALTLQRNDMHHCAILYVEVHGLACDHCLDLLHRKVIDASGSL